MKKYEATIIFRDSLQDADWDGAVDSVRAEIARQGGTLASCTRLGRREFARPMKKQTAGHYGFLAFELDGDKIPALLARLKLNENVFRIQVVNASGQNAPAPVPDAPAEEQPQ